ncbi:cation-transporting P-type ATPase [Legionella parisiensis]|uniref:Putative cation-transporting ATPase F n=1 Tax=Legionella parisiensis TaxID=45071 RepID=A0A1E5JWF6_9GAMM|nr:cation-transporting P-type ATPase [Legionella parisiensis]KTD41800.1 cation efflux transporter [Legionella parisiensis]OEH48851.1 putative cation-transporting ATPase F [Legionella parisiensis]STX75874.1 cation efflux transporter [Legionella parisiensis]
MEEQQNIFSEPCWHEQSKETILSTLNATEMGLSEAESQSRLKIYGFNRLPEPPKTSTFFRFILQFHNILIYVLLAAALVTSFLQHWIDTAVILAVVIINALIGFIQEGKAEKALDAIQKMFSPTAIVVRDGERVRIASEKLVPGDIIVLEAGDKVPADVRLIKSHGLTTQEAILTGESVPVEKHIHPVSRNAALGDRTCMAFSGTLVTNGQGKGIVVETGSTTQIGCISGLLSRVETLTTPLVLQMGLFAKWLTLFILLIAAILLVYGYFVQHHPFGELFMVVVGLSVAAIPEGLPAVLSITLAIGVQAMAKRHTIVRRLPAIETLGSVSVICADKTGTLTQNEMTVSSVLTSNHWFILDSISYEPQGTITLNEQVIDSNEYPLLKKLARAATLCNDATLHDQEGNWTVEGDPMEGALLAFAVKTGLILKEENASWVRTDVIPFDARHRFMATLNHNHLKHAMILVKGAPEQVLKMCQNQQSNWGEIQPLNEMYWKEQMEQMAARGQRVLAFAIKKAKTEHTVLEFADIEGSLTLLGMVGLIDPPRPESISALAQCHAAGIAVKMITGDHASTALAIGRQIGLKNLDKVLTGVDLDNMNDATLRNAVLDTDIFARTSPEHKLRLVMALQSHGMTVAMTGDGVNDAPALKRADAGIAMGRKGSEVAKEAAEFILTDDNFASIVAAIREGRTVYDNLKKVISWTLPTNAGEAMTIILALLLGLSLPVTAIQILWINLITAATLGLALAFEPTEEGTMHRPPRPQNEPLLTGSLVWHIILVSILFICGIFGIYFYALDRGYSLELARTIALNTLVVLEIFHLFYIRNIYTTSLTWKAVKGTKIVWMAVIVITVAQFAITYFSPLQTIFVTEAIPFWDGVLIVVTGVLFFAVIETEKQLRLRISTIRHVHAGKNTLYGDKIL